MRPTQITPARRRTPARLAQDEGVCLNSIYRYMLKGTRGPDGKIVRLQGTRIGQRWHISDQAWQAFLAALNPPHQEYAPIDAGRRVDPRVDAELDRLLGPA